MARLPISGSDDGQWGNLLNDFLLQSHKTDGTLKDNVLSAANIPNSTVSAAKLQASNSPSSGQVLAYSGGSLQWTTPTEPTTNTDSLRSLLIFYAPPTTINAKFDLDYAAGIIARYDDVVFGTGLEDSGNAYHADTAAIISKVAALSPSTVIWGYIDTGISTGNLSLATINGQIDSWLAMGAKGIFLDVFGYDYGVTRTRQNAILNYIHSKNVGAILNVFNPDQALSSQVDATYNPGGTATAATNKDVLLLESWVFNSDAYASPYYATFSDIKTRADKARTYRQSLGIRIFAVNIIQHSGATTNAITDRHSFAEALARIWRLDASGVAVSNYASTGADVSVVSPRFFAIPPTPSRPNAPYYLNNAWTQIQAPDLGLTVDYDTGVHTWSRL